jgi:transcriptional antiterminator RfaH
MKEWYTLQTKPNAEYQVRSALQQREIQTYLPEIETPKTRNECKKKPFFPCYVFGRIDLEVVGVSCLQWTPGLRRIVTFDDRPVPLPDEVIELIQRRLGEIETAGGWPIYAFKPGDTVRITNGPFRDMQAIFDGLTTPDERVQVLLNILGHASRVHVNVADLEEVPPETKEPKPKRPRRTRGRGRRISDN